MINSMAKVQPNHQLDIALATTTDITWLLDVLRLNR